MMTESILIEGLAPEEVTQLASCSRECLHQDGEAIIEESSTDRDLFLLLEGRASVEIRTPNPDTCQMERKPLTILKTGEIFGEIAFLRGVRRVASVYAVGAVRTLRFDSHQLKKIMEAHPHLGYVLMHNLAAILAQRLIDLNFMWRDEV